MLWLLLGCIASIVLFALGDDDYNLLLPDTNWFLFHETLIATFFFLFVRYSNSELEEFKKADFIFFLPYLLNVSFQALLTLEALGQNQTLELLTELTEFGLVGMLFWSIYDVVSNNKERWLLSFLVPFTVIFIIDEASFLLFDTRVSLWSLDSYGIFLVAVFLFYIVTYKLIASPRHILPRSAGSKYKESNRSKSEVELVKQELHRLMVEEKLFTNQKLKAEDVAQRLGISKQYLSEVLNVHLGMRFQDLLNEHRVEEFIQYLHRDGHQKFNLYGIATEVGFSSKSSFNAAFKKAKGMTPSQYRKTEI